jgi:hypothetical protein
MPDVPAETVTLEGETDSEKLLEDEPELVAPQPERTRPRAARASMHERRRIRRKRQLIKPARSNPTDPKPGAVKGNMALEEIVAVLALWKAWTLPLWTEALEQFAVPVYSVNVSLTALVPLTVAFEML